MESDDRQSTDHAGGLVGIGCDMTDGEGAEDDADDRCRKGQESDQEQFDKSRRRFGGHGSGLWTCRWCSADGLPTFRAFSSHRESLEVVVALVARPVTHDVFGKCCHKGTRVLYSNALWPVAPSLEVYFQVRVLCTASTASANMVCQGVGPLRVAGSIRVQCGYRFQSIARSG